MGPTLNDFRVVFQKHIAQVAVDEGIEAGEGERLVGEVEAHERSAERVEALPVDQRRRAHGASD